MNRQDAKTAKTAKKNQSELNSEYRHPRNYPTIRLK